MLELLLRRYNEVNLAKAKFFEKPDKAKILVYFNKWAKLGESLNLCQKLEWLKSVQRTTTTTTWQFSLETEGKRLSTLDLSFGCKSHYCQW